MKKVFICFVVFVLSVFCFTACAPTHDITIENNHLSDNMSMFVIIEKTDFFYVVYHKESKVMYSVSSGGNNCGNFTVLVDKDNKPLLWNK